MPEVPRFANLAQLALVECASAKQRRIQIYKTKRMYLQNRRITILQNNTTAALGGGKR